MMRVLSLSSTSTFSALVSPGMYEINVGCLYPYKASKGVSFVDVC